MESTRGIAGRAIAALLLAVAALQAAPLHPGGAFAASCRGCSGERCCVGGRGGCCRRPAPDTSICRVSRCGPESSAALAPHLRPPALPPGRTPAPPAPREARAAHATAIDPLPSPPRIPPVPPPRLRAV